MSQPVLYHMPADVLPVVAGGEGLDSMRQDQVPNTNFLDCLAGVNRAKIKLPVIHSYILSFTPSFRLVSLFYWNLQIGRAHV